MVIKQRKIKGAVSLLELVVVIAIVSMLAVAAVPSYERYVMKSKISSIMPVISGFKPDIIKDHNYGVVFGNTSSDLIPANAAHKPQYINILRRGAYGCIEAVFDLDQVGVSHDINSVLTLVVCPVTDSAGNTDDWVCGYSSDTSSEYFGFFPEECEQEITRDTSF